METKLTSVDLIFHRETEDGVEIEVKANLSPDYGWAQWGATTQVLGDNVEALAAIEAALVDEWANTTKIT